MANSSDNEKPLRKIAEAFKDLSNAVKDSQTLDNHNNSQLELAPFSHACSLVSPLFRCLGIAFRFAEMDYVAKVSKYMYICINWVYMYVVWLID